MLHFAGADAERQRAERAVRGGVAIAADHRHAGLRQARAPARSRARCPAVAVRSRRGGCRTRRSSFRAARPVGARSDRRWAAIASRGGHAVVRGGDGQIGPPHFQAALAQPEGLRRGDFVDQVQVDVEQRRGARLLATTWVSQSFSMIVRGCHSCFTTLWPRTRPAPTCSVVAGLPFGLRSAVTRPHAQHLSDGRIHGGRLPVFKPKLYSSIAATEPMAPSGLALFWPAMSGAEPCTGSYSHPCPDGLADRGRRQHADRTCQHRRLIAQDIAEHVLGQHDVERVGRSTSCMAQLSTSIDPARHPEIRAATSITTRRQSCEFSSTFDLSTLVTFLRRFARQLEGHAGDALDFRARVGHGVDRPRSPLSDAARRP